MFVISNIISYLLIASFFILPITLGARNWYFTFKYPKMTEEERANNKYSRSSIKKTDVAIIIFGAFCAWFWTGLFEISSYSFDKNYDEAVYVGEMHSFLHTEYRMTVWVTLAIAMAALIILSVADPVKFPPVPQALCFGFAVIGEVLYLFLIIQLTSLPFCGLAHIYYLANLIMITARVTKRYIMEHLSYKEEHDTQYIHESAKPVEKALQTVASLTELHFIMILPAAVILIAIFILLGQGPDGIIKAFTMTADWTFSTQTPPPPIDYEGHYLCTVAAGGHKKVVKPVRYGRRRGDIIVVNRQLLASNAFEDMIMERTPKFHRAVRSFYDKHGYPISRHITTKTRADMVYIIMKPLEWLFILSLYTFDAHPENRIAVQYSDYRK
ncbi:MAG: hypothetical protein IJ779_10820 [Ruminococcus sp.]|nr:hypothetical protein [Ruminococcus sp.]